MELIPSTQADGKGDVGLILTCEEALAFVKLFGNSSLHDRKKISKITKRQDDLLNRVWNALDDYYDTYDVEVGYD